MPLIARGNLKGTLNIYREGDDACFTDEEFRLAMRFGDAAALALDNAHIRASLEQQAQTDPLTGLLNHRAFHERLRKELLRASSTRDTVALVMLDLDDFKKVNDIHGHAMGDLVLATIAGHLQGAIRDTDVVCRIGGEEFAIIAPSVDLRTAQLLAERVSACVAEAEYEAAGRVSVSVGVALGPEHAANPRELVACAEVGDDDRKGARQAADRRLRRASIATARRLPCQPGRRPLDRPPEDAARPLRASSTA